MGLKVFGIDPSPSGTAIAIFEDGVLQDVHFCVKTKIVSKKYKNATYVPNAKMNDEPGRLKRLRIVNNLLINLIQTHKPEYIALEDFLWHSRHIRSSIVQAELGGALRATILDYGIKLRTYEPSTIKIFYVGKGDADKTDMMKKGKTDSSLKSLGLCTLEDKDLNNVVDAVAIGYLLNAELQVRNGFVMVKDLPKNVIHIFNRVTIPHPNCLLDCPFVEWKNED